VKIQVNSDSSIRVDQRMIDFVESHVQGALQRFDARLTRAEVHLSDRNATKGGADDKRCLIEARPAGQDPIAVEELAASLDLAVRGATHKMQRLLDSHFARLAAHA
jgi:hypothetical protein